MKNFEKFEKEIMEITRKGYAVALSNNKLTDCGSIVCPKCDWSSYNNKDSSCCDARKMLWLYSEHKERPKLTKQERKFCELLEEKDVWLVRNKVGTLYFYTIKPVKGDSDWAVFGHVCTTRYYSIFDVLGTKFDFIKWEDEEPWHISELLKLEVEE